MLTKDESAHEGSPETKGDWARQPEKHLSKDRVWHVVRDHFPVDLNHAITKLDTTRASLAIWINTSHEKTQPVLWIVNLRPGDKSKIPLTLSDIIIRQAKEIGETVAHHDAEPKSLCVPFPSQHPIPFSWRNRIPSLELCNLLRLRHSVSSASIQRSHHV